MLLTNPGTTHELHQRVATGQRRRTRLAKFNLGVIALSRRTGGFERRPPTNVKEVLDWARSRFSHEVTAHHPDGSINLAKACLLIGLEEAAAAALVSDARQRLEDALLLDQDSDDDSQGGTPALHRRPSRSSALYERIVGNTSIWSLSQLDALAAEVIGLIDSTSPGVGSGVQEWGIPGLFPRVFKRSFVEGAAPLQIVSAVNEVLFERHGFQRMGQHGDPRDSQLPFLLDRGTGSPAALTLLYVEVCSRVGLQLDIAQLDGGSYWLCWPRETSALRMGGEEFVIDAYGGGDLIHMAEVSELFDIPSGYQSDYDCDVSDSSVPYNCLLVPASPRDILAATLGDLLHAHWCAAVGCPAEPALALPLSSQIVLYGHFLSVDEFHIDRALAAAERKLMVQPSSLTTQRQYGLLLYLDEQYDNAWQELGVYCEMAAEEGITDDEDDISSVHLLCEKCRLLLEVYH